MCLAIPGKIREIDGNIASFSYKRANYHVDVSLLSDVKVGDYVLMHDGRALSKISKAEYDEQLEFIKTHEEMACHNHHEH